MQTEAPMILHFTLAISAKIKKYVYKTLYFDAFFEIGSLTYCLWKHKLIKPLWEVIVAIC